MQLKPLKIMLQGTPRQSFSVVTHSLRPFTVTVEIIFNSFNVSSSAVLVSSCTLDKLSSFTIVMVELIEVSPYTNIYRIVMQKISYILMLHTSTLSWELACMGIRLHHNITIARSSKYGKGGSYIVYSSSRITTMPDSAKGGE